MFPNKCPIYKLEHQPFLIIFKIKTINKLISQYCLRKSFVQNTCSKSAKISRASALVMSVKILSTVIRESENLYRPSI
jgi:hypothetical protein